MLLTSLDQSQTVSLALQDDRGDQALDLGRGVALLLAFLQRQRATDHVRADIVFLGQVVELADFAGALRPQATRDVTVGQALDFLLALLDDDQSQNGHVAVDDASADGLALAFSVAARAIARVVLLQQQADTG